MSPSIWLTIFVVVGCVGVLYVEDHYDNRFSYNATVLHGFDAESTAKYANPLVEHFKWVGDECRSFIHVTNDKYDNVFIAYCRGEYDIPAYIDFWCRTIGWTGTMCREIMMMGIRIRCIERADGHNMWSVLTIAVEGHRVIYIGQHSIMPDGNDPEYTCYQPFSDDNDNYKSLFEHSVRCKDSCIRFDDDMDDFWINE